MERGKRGTKLQHELMKLGLPHDLFEIGFKERLTAAIEAQKDLMPTDYEWKEIDDPLAVLYAAGARPYQPLTFKRLIRQSTFWAQNRPKDKPRHPGGRSKPKST